MTRDANIHLQLQAAYAQFIEPQAFEPGSLVRWKRGYRHKRTEGPFVVVDVLTEPVIDLDGDPGSPYYREPLDIVLGHIDDDGNFLTYHYDSRRFESLPPQPAAFNA